MPPVKKSAEQKKVEASRKQAKRLEILTQLANGELTAEQAEKLLVSKPDREWEVTASPDGKKVMLKGIYTRFPLTLWPAHIKRMEDEGFWDQMVTQAEILLLTNPVNEDEQKEAPSTKDTSTEVAPNVPDAA